MECPRAGLWLLAALALAALAAGCGAVDGGDQRASSVQAVRSAEAAPARAARANEPAGLAVRTEPRAAAESGEIVARETIETRRPERPAGNAPPENPPPPQTSRSSPAATSAPIRGSKMNLSAPPIRRPTDGRPVLLTAMGDTIPYAPMGKTIGRSPLEDSPGYRRVFDPESSAVVTGRRQVAVHDRSLGQGARSAEELALWILDALAAEDREQLKALLVTPKEFSEILWPEFPESRPITRLEAKDSWFFLERTSLAGINQALNLVGGTRLEFERITYEVGFAPYTNFALYHGARIHARGPDGEPVVLDFADSFVECRGVWKVYTYKD